MRIRLVTLLTALLALAAGSPAFAANLLINGDFETTSYFYIDGGGSQVFEGSTWGPYFTDQNTGAQVQTVAGWTNYGFNFIIKDNFAPSVSGSPQSPSYFSLWGPNNGAANGLTASPTGGNFIASDGAYRNAPLQQTVTGLEIGRQYAVSFWWAGAQQFGYDGATTDAWQICFGVCSFTTNYDGNEDGYATFDPGSGEIQTTDTIAVDNHGFVPWRYEYMTFTATSSTQTLSLLSYGTPLGQPPFALIDGIQLQAVPEPTTWAMMLIGFGVVGGVMRTRRKSTVGRRALNAQIV